VNDLQEKVEEQEKKQDEQDQQAASPSGSSGHSSGDDIQNISMTPAQAVEGVVVVSSGFNTIAATAEEAAVINAAIEYYQYAEVSDYYTTYNLLSYEDQNNYTQDQWVAANTNLDSAAGEFVVTDAYPDDLGLGVRTRQAWHRLFTRALQSERPGSNKEGDDIGPATLTYVATPREFRRT